MHSLAAALLLVRHGHTAGNDSGHDVRMSGWTDLPLTPEGVRQARALALHLAEGPRICAIYTSPLQRAARTAEAIALACGAPSVIAADLREINCGEADGLTIATVKERFPVEWARNLAQDDPDFRWPGGESYRELRARSLAALRTIAESHPGERVVIVTHAGVITQVLGHITGESEARWEVRRPRNASLTELDWNGATPRIVRFDVVPAPKHAA